LSTIETAGRSGARMRRKTSDDSWKFAIHDMSGAQPALACE
jgi:hypothetical protein